MIQFPLFSYLSNVVPSPPLTAFTNKFGAHAWETRLAPFAQRLLYLLLRFLGIALSAICWQLYNHVFNCWRHVENHVILMPDNAKKTPAVKMLLRDDFYIPPVELEIVNDHHFLGFDVLPNQRRMTFIFIYYAWLQPQYNGPIRHPYSACYPKLLYSGLRSRIALIFAYSFPCAELEPQAWRPCGFFIDNGYEQSQVPNHWNRSN